MDTPADRGDTRSSRTPRTQDEVAALLRERPAFWEYRLYAAYLLAAMTELDDEYRDHLLRYAPLSGEVLDDTAALTRLQAAFPDVQALTDSIMRFFTPEAQERAFGKPGEDGDAELIRHLAHRTIGGLRELMDWARDLRSARVPTEWRRAFNLLADTAHNPVEEIREYVHQAVETIDQLEDLAEGATEDEPVEITVHLVLTADEELIDSFTAELARLEATY